MIGGAHRDKNPVPEERIVAALKAIQEADPNLKPRDLHVIAGRAAGLNGNQVAARYNLDKRTVRRIIAQNKGLYPKVQEFIRCSIALQEAEHIGGVVAKIREGAMDLSYENKNGGAYARAYKDYIFTHDPSVRIGDDVTIQQNVQVNLGKLEEFTQEELDERLKKIDARVVG